MSEVDNLRKEVEELRLKDVQEMEIKRLRQEKFRLQHKGLMGASGIISRTFSGIMKVSKRIGKGVMEAGNNYDKSLKKQRQDVIKVNPEKYVNQDIINID